MGLTRSKAGAMHPDEIVYYDYPGQITGPPPGTRSILPQLIHPSISFYSPLIYMLFPACSSKTLIPIYGTLYGIYDVEQVKASEGVWARVCPLRSQFMILLRQFGMRGCACLPYSPLLLMPSLLVGYENCAP
jgi:hypothetical protein